jgi:hypothetical protein
MTYGSSYRDSVRNVGIVDVLKMKPAWRRAKEVKTKKGYEEKIPIPTTGSARRRSRLQNNNQDQ